MEALEHDIAELQEGASRWAATGLPERIALLREIRPLIVRHARAWVDAAVAAKGLPPDSALAGEEWMSGPYGVLYGINRYVRTLTALAKYGRIPLPAPVCKRADGNVVARVFPAGPYDRLIFSGITADVWLPRDVDPELIQNSMAAYYRQSSHHARVALVLGAGNIAAIGPLDVLYKLIADGAVCLLKMNPVNEYLAPIYRNVFAPLIESGFLRIVTGGADVGQFLTAHPGIDEIHITGSAQTHDAIVFSDGTKTQRRTTKPITSELGNVSPTIVVPGKWTAADIRFQAEHIATQKMHNGGFNCIASQVLILPESWPQRAELELELQRALERAGARPAYYPGARERKEGIGGDATLIRLDAARDEPAFKTEAFCGVLALITLPGENARTFFANAVAFANERLAGTLGANIIIDPQTQKRLGPAFEDGIAALRYGSIGINAWTGVAFLLAESTWGAYPGHTLDDIQSGIGLVHNAFLFDRALKTVIAAPFRPFPRGLAHGSLTLLPKPPWFVTNGNAADIGRRLLAFEFAPGILKIPGLFLSALRG